MIIPFAKGPEEYFADAQTALDAQDFQTAAFHLKKVIQLTDDEDLYALYLTCLMEIGDYSEAIIFFEERIPDIADIDCNPDWDMLYGMLLLQLGDPEELEEFLTGKYKRYKKRKKPTEVLDLLSEELAIYHQATATIKEDSLILFNEKMKQGQYKTLLQQASLMTYLLELDDTHFIEKSMHLLLVENLHPFVRTDILDELYIRDYTGSVHMDWYGQLRHVDMSQYELFIDEDWFSEAMAYIDKTYQDEQLRDILAHHLTLYVSMVHPFAQEVIADGVEWVETIAALHAHQPIPEKYQAWFTKFEALLNAE